MEKKKSNSNAYHLIVSFLIMVIAFMAMVPETLAKANSGEIDSKSAIAVDAKSGQIIYQKNATKNLPAASMSKLLTAYIVQKRVHDHQLKWNDQVTISPEVAKLSTKKGFTNVKLDAHKKYTVKSLYSSALIGSANASAMALGDKVAGNSQNFAKTMRSTAKKLGIRDAQFYNACGLTNEQVAPMNLPKVQGDDENEMSARDTAIISQKIINQDPAVLKTTKQENYTFSDASGKQKEVVKTSDEMLRGQRYYNPALNVDCLKTGMSKKAGENFAGTLDNHHGHRIITVIMGAKPNQRFVVTKELMDHVIRNYRPMKYDNDQFKLRVRNGKQKEVKVKMAKSITLWGKIAQPDQFTNKIKLDPKVSKNNEITAPVLKNQKIGTNQVGFKNQKVEFLNQSGGKAPIVTGQSVDKVNFFVRLYRDVVSFF
ncbi:D-alanyl-D-alanine carboxypeptidase family protein [Fructilactobacillus fructivorans]|uniref:D-alanyl-D-alanine carboxypeptidase family protein n=1 Tax=Fructilactobacillus fructivorans TaxID=1614 RepID=UPI000704A559|nr:D-alanyl-D-alanine carboxypeptidase family protein [Fructilactobacillus fructivorans]KRN42950.1 D-alanyl-D-alanine carboxypeptidase [Fructilactobacillus fructivorans]